MPFIKEIVSGKNRIGIWKISGSELSIWQSLNEDKEVLEKYSRTEIQRIAVRLLLKEMLGELPKLEKNKFGKPILSDYSMHISLSHTDGFVAVMLGPNNVGIDVQVYKPKIMSVRHKFLNESESALVNTVEKTTLFWSAKEAIYKYNGKTGLFFREHIFIEYVNTSTLTCYYYWEEKKIFLLLNWQELDEKTVLVWTN